MEFGKLYNLSYMGVIVILLITIAFGYIKKKKISEFLKIKISKIKYFKELIFVVGAVLVIFSLTEPKKEIGVEKVDRDGIDIYFLVDISKSMMCSDLKPSRLDRTKESMKKIISALDGDRVGFIPFSSAAYIQMPLTDDYEMANTFLDMIDSTLISGGGTDIAAAIKTAKSAFENSKSSEKVMIVFSDGEDQENREFDDKNEEKISIYGAAVGTETGSAVPELNSEGKINGFKRDENGNIVISKVTKESLEKIAKNYNGKVYKIDTITDDTDKIISDILNMKGGKIKEDEKKVYKEYYQYFLGVGIVLMLIGYIGIGLKRK